jgi:hypothetical protein
MTTASPVDEVLTEKAAFAELAPGPKSANAPREAAKAEVV